MTQASSFALCRTQSFLRFLSQAIDIHKYSFDSRVTRCTSLKRFNQRLDIPQSVVADAVNKECRCAVHSASHPAKKVSPHTLTIGAFLQLSHNSLCVQTQLFGVHQ